MPRILPFALATLPLFAAHAQSRKEYAAALVGFYNVENIYDTLDAPGVDDAEFLPGSAKNWTSQRYWSKLDRMAKVIAGMGKDLHPQGLAILGLAEVENRGVVEDLVARPLLRDRGYRVVHEDGPDRRGVDVALIYNPGIYRVYAHRSHRLRMPGDTAFRTRDQLLVSGVLDGDTTHVIVAHWPSRRGGQKASEPRRRAAAELGRRIIDSLMAIGPRHRILYMGDLNDDPVNVSVTRFLKATGDRKKAVGGTLFNPMHEPYQRGIGTLAWRDSWNLFDQIIINAPLLTGEGGRYRYYGARIYNEEFLRQKEGAFAGYPYRSFVGDAYQEGYSDHFPVFLILVKEVGG
ncbi:MAG: endonuclease/exonuclease/phosphatase family protein [Flavobacteriales bacterium]